MEVLLFCRNSCCRILITDHFIGDQLRFLNATETPRFFYIFVWEIVRVKQSALREFTSSHTNWGPFVFSYGICLTIFPTITMIQIGFSWLDKKTSSNWHPQPDDLWAALLSHRSQSCMRAPWDDQDLDLIRPFLAGYVYKFLLHLQPDDL